MTIKMQALIFAVIAFCVSGCVSSDMMAVGGRTFPPRSNDYVIDVYGTTDAPVQFLKEIAFLKPLSSLPSNSAEIGRIDSSGAPAASWASVVEDAKQKARKLGGDGLVITAWGAPMTGVGGYGEAYYGKVLSMKVVRYQP